MLTDKPKQNSPCKVNFATSELYQSLRKEQQPARHRLARQINWRDVTILLSYV
jgi:hypothetical protein